MRKLISIFLLLVVCSSTLAGGWTGRKPMLGVQVNWADPLSKGLVGCWPMNERSGGKVFDLSGHGNDGTLYANAHFVPGKFGCALDFDGAGDYFQTSTSSALAVVEGTIVGWWKVSSSCADYAFFIYLYQDASNSVKIYVDATNNLTFWAEIADSTIIAVEPSGMNIKDDQCHQIAVTWDSSAATIYKDGVYVASQSGDKRLNWPGSPYLNVGKDNFLGQNSHLDIFNRALTAGEIARLYREPFVMLRPSWNWRLYAAIAVPSVTGQIIIININ